MEGPMRFAGRGPLSETEPLWSTHIQEDTTPQELLPSLSWGPTKSHLEGITEAIQDRNLERDANQSFTSGWNQGWEDLKPSHLTPGYDEMVNAGYDSWSPSDNIRVDGSMFNTGGTDFTPILGGALPYLTSTAVDTRSDWQKWKDSFKEDWKAK